MDTFQVIISIFLGIGLSAAVGFRVFLPLLALSIAGYFDVIPLNDNWEWIGSIVTIIVMAIATFIEILGYYIPWVDNLLDTIAIPLATVAGTMVMVATMADLEPVVTWTLAIIAGGGTAAAVKGSASALRLTSSATTGGIANPVVATVETGGATVMSLSAIFIPILAFVFVVIILIFLVKFLKKLRKNPRTQT